MTTKINKQLDSNQATIHYPSRLAAWTILVKVTRKQGQSHVLLNQWALQHQDWPIRERNFVFQLVHGTLTWKPFLDALASKYIKPTKTSLPIQVLIWLSFYQFLSMDRVPNYAVVNEAVKIAKKISLNAGKFVNAVLQSALRDQRFKELPIDLENTNEDYLFTLEHAFPYPLYQQLVADFGNEIARKVVLDSLVKPRLSFRINTLKLPVGFYESDAWKALNAEPGLVENSFYTTKITALKPLLDQGIATIQDQGALLVVPHLEPLPPAPEVWDMCCAPGGKLSQLSALLNNRGQILGTEINPHKIPMIQQNLNRLGVKNVQLEAQDALIDRDQSFDAILLDAPCSGLGVFKRKPEIKWNFNQSTLPNLIQLQADLLDQAADHLKDKGVLVYSTCTINKAENQEQINQFLKRHPNWTKVYENQRFGYEDQTDGFYIAKLIKK